MSRDILIVGATGQQGRAVINALFAPTAHHGPPIRILALTRSASSPKAQALQTSYPDIVLVEGDTRNPAPIFAANPSIAAVFLVTVPPDEEEQALPFIEAAVASGTHVDHVVFTSVDRGGDLESWTHPTEVPHFAAKHRIEIRLRQLCDSAGRRWTILRPTGFMDTYNPGFFGKLMASLWRTGAPNHMRMQLVSTHDIGIFGAKALSNPEEWAGKAVALAGDELSFSELRDIFGRTVGKELPQSYSVLAWVVLWSVKDARKSFEWYNTAGHGADIASLRQQHPDLQTFEKWLQESSQWKKDNGVL
ncbi:hypothetical protein QBC33DRAFT_541677 [Phialemonium atrogriseum]|uniref:NmrA-like domain-containing protein n=1 Tax=Phialemonium atrogriseum TaxID=1093897 RepID=A0AAJ0BY59_9PEZI|nr:uncharacterized protein QBC33DRAFT_541677 [Phialemonium atrogriseum]KAK1766655.1 hypothetical protein QBC33DRAFT_541677 [Phialemonium atrogriseum]